MNIFPWYLLKISPFTKQTDLESPFLACSPQSNLLQDNQKSSEALLSAGGWFPDVASPEAPRLSGSGPLSALFHTQGGTATWLLLSPLMQL